MNPSEVLRIVDAIHRDKKIEKEIVFSGVESALVTAARKHYGDEADIDITIDRESGEITGSHNGIPMDPAEMAERIGAQTAKQVMIQKIREAERDTLYDEYITQIDQIVSGVVQRNEGGTLTVALSNVEALLPRGEKLPGENLRINDRIRATIIDVKKSGNRVKVFLSRIRPALVQRLFEQEIPEIVDGVIEIKAIAREAGYRTKIAVYSSDQRIDCVGACVGVRGSRVKPIGTELGDERIDVVPWDEDLLVFIPNALKPAEVEEVILCGMLGRAIVLVQQDQRSLAIGRKGQNVRLASKLCGWDIEIMSRDDLESMLEKALVGFSDIEGVDEELADRLVGEGFLTYDDLSIIEPDDLMEMGGLTEAQVDKIVEEAERRAEEEEIAEEEAKAAAVSAAEATDPEVPAPAPEPLAEGSAELDTEGEMTTGGSTETEGEADPGTDETENETPEEETSEAAETSADALSEAASTEEPPEETPSEIEEEVGRGASGEEDPPGESSEEEVPKS